MISMAKYFTTVLVSPLIVINKKKMKCIDPTRQKYFIITVMDFQKILMG